MKLSGLRWWVVGLIALATVINYIDRPCTGGLALCATSPPWWQ